MMLSESRIQGVLASLESRVPVPVTASGGDFDLAQWFLFRPAIGIDALSVGNPQGFSATPLLTAEKVYAQVALLPLFSGRTEVHSIRLASPVLTVERDRNGRTNLETVLDAISRNGAAGKSDQPPEGASGGAVTIDAFRIDDGVIRYVDPAAGKTPLTLRDIDLALTDFSSDSSCRFTLAAALFESGSSRVSFDGRGGPFKAESMPAEGDLSFELAPAEMPAELRERIFGQLLRDPGGSSRAVLNASVKGDLIKSIQGAGKLTLSSFEIGPDAANRLPLVGEAPLNVTVRRPLARPGYELAIQGGSLQLGQGSWKGDAQVRYDGNRFQGDSSGSIGGVRIEELLHAFTSSRDKAFGRAEIPSYRLSFAGRDAA
ncbi:MAG TPA: AsmA family protein, partial [Sphingomonadaceae bacterium]|nr:AsmA family protein [Sphingomonadaceae bacterium]